MTSLGHTIGQYGTHDNEIDELIAESDRVVVRWSLIGTHKMVPSTASLQLIARSC
jgi:hypothetical protein